MPHSDTATDWASTVADANIPALLMLVFQFTGDARWLAPPYAPTRTAGLEEHDDGGLSEAARAEVREAAARALRRTASGDQPAIARPDVATIMTMLSVCMGEPVTTDQATLLAAEWDRVTGASRVGESRATSAPVAGERHSTVLVIGAGVSALTLSRELIVRGVDHVLVEKEQDLGGAWRENTYPGCGVDTPSYLYSHSYYRYDWSQYYAKRDEVFDYLHRYAEDQGILPHIRFDADVTALDWDEDAAHWRVSLRHRNGTTSQRTASVVVTATGQLNLPKIPDLSAAADFGGELFHSARWPDRLELAGRRVAIVGSGASAMQILPRIVGVPRSITVYQRSPQWIAQSPVYFEGISASKRALLELSPVYRFWYRARLEWTINDKVHPSLQKDPHWEHPERSINRVNDAHRALYERYLRSKLEGRDDLIAKTIPAYPPFGKRMLIDNGWFDALRHESVELVAEAVAGFTKTSVVTASGAEREADVVVLATGFEAVKLLHPMQVRGRSGVDLHEYWGPDDAHAYLGMSVPGFPNLFVMCGPNTNLGHGGSWIQVSEMQADYIAQAIGALVAAPARSMEVKAGIERAYTARVDAQHARMIWSHPGMRNWYTNAAGRVVTNTPWRIVDYWGLTRTFSRDDFEWAP